ncbi:uncharacterized protein N7479_005185 [Penicillium vulpinum]|uniref:BTB domain-containing protein n=1 Tax=Penicillium vulpinum TaxID=29845 RepID=A0A1V6RFJ4_9EURO|nr:uncharacterized protein N7479_005185 [Penicillium vulpinum]KAJ5958035.1 hypothetical protein N7479_005185 [Penicillium vulpinum]OQE00294.1 hypothetical protein PENVUL_c054G05597 [Penicillium vulpinum]
MPGHHHCNAHTGLPRVWLGWGELGDRKAQLQAEQNAYFKTNAPDFKLRHPGNRRRGWDVHLNVIRRSTRWIDWRIHKTGDKYKLVLPDLVCLEQVNSLVNFLYTGDYSVDEADLSYYSVRACPGGCVTCPQICQLLRIHLSMFQTALLLRITDLQALAFRRFRDLMNTAPAFVLQYAVHAVYSREPIPDGSNNFQITGLKSVSDYRPELVLPAVLRYCGYYRMNPQQITRHGKKVRVFGEKEFTELRRKSRKFDGDLALGIWLDTIDITVPTIQFPGNSEPIRSLHPYMTTPLAPQAADPKRSNYQYVNYLQPLPFKEFSDQKISNTPTWTPSPENTSTGSFTTPQTSLQRMQTRSPLNQGNQASVQQTPDLPQLDLEQTEDLGFLDDAAFDTTMDQIIANLPQDYSTGPVDSDNIDWTNTMDWSGANAPDIDFSQLLGDDAMDEPDTNADAFDLQQAMNWTGEDLANMDLTNVDLTQFLNTDAMGEPDVNANALDSTQAMNWTGEDLANVDFTQLLNDDTLDLQCLDPSVLDLPMDMDMGLGLPEPNSFDLPDMGSFDMTGLPDIDLSGLTSQNSMDSAFLTQHQAMDMDAIFPLGMDPCVNVPQEMNFLPQPLNSMMDMDFTASSFRNQQSIQTALPTKTLTDQQAVRSVFTHVQANAKSRASVPRQRQDSTQTRYNLRSRPSMADSKEEL